MKHPHRIDSRFSLYIAHGEISISGAQTAHARPLPLRQEAEELGTTDLKSSVLRVGYS